jgi:hypothetical protein
VKAPGSPQNHVGRHRGAHQRQLIARTSVSSSRTSPSPCLATPSVSPSPSRKRAVYGAARRREGSVYSRPKVYVPGVRY